MDVRDLGRPLLTLEAFVALHARFLVRPNLGVFAPMSFAELLQSRISMPGLDPLWRHTLVDVKIGEGGAYAELTVVSEPPPARPVDTALRVVNHTPPARVRVIDEGGNVLHEGDHPTPFRNGQHVEVGGKRYRVAKVAWPGRNRRGVCTGDLDWQHVTVTEAEPPVLLPARAS